MMSKTWTQRIGMLLAAGSLLIVLAGQIWPAGREKPAGTLNSDGTITSLQHTKCINVDPAATTTDWIFFYTEWDITINHIRCLVDAATSVVMTLQKCDADGANCTDIEAAMTCLTTKTSETGTIDSPSVSAGKWVRVTRGSLTGSATQAAMCVTYTDP